LLWNRNRSARGNDAADREEGKRGTVYWIRSNLRGLARLALFTLAVQITLTFGHVHLDGLAPASAQAAAPFAEQAAAPLAKAPGKNQKSHGTADLDCPICALIQLASTCAPSVVPPLPVPAILGDTILETPGAEGFSASPTFAFQARGPPAL
jgi:hypothetical protein